MLTLESQKISFFSKSKNNIENLAREALDIDPKCLWMKWLVPITHTEGCINFLVGWKIAFSHAKSSLHAKNSLLKLNFGFMKFFQK